MTMNSLQLCKYLSASLLLLILSTPLAQSLMCVSNSCQVGTDFCTEECFGPHTACVATYLIAHTGTVQPSVFACAAIENETEVCDTSCNLTPVPGGIPVHTCCCTTDHCNWIDGVVDFQPPPSVMVPPTPAGPTPIVPEGHLVCALHSCNDSLCTLGYVACLDHPLAPENPNRHFCISQYRQLQTSSLSYGVEFKGCAFDLTDCSLDQCDVDTQRGSRTVGCCCQGHLCNVNDTFSDPSLVIHEVNPCTEAGCEHSCVVRDGQPSCLCREGYAVDSTDMLRCVDIDECLDPNTRCDFCENLYGSFRCVCPVEEGLRLADDGHTCEFGGLTCERFTCNDPDTSVCGLPTVEFCVDRETSSVADHCHSLYSLNADGVFRVRTKSCFTFEDSSQCGTDECVLRRFPSSNHPPLFDCCCSGPLCNRNIVFPNITNIETPTTEVTTSTTVTVTDGTTSPTTDSPTPQPFISLIVTGPIAVLFVVAACIMVCVCCRLKWRHKPEQEYDQMQLDVIQPASANEIEFDQPIGQGRPEVTVMRGRYGGREVAIKRFAPTVESYRKEREIYETPGFANSNILKFIAAVEIPNYNCLVLEQHPTSLYDHLKENTCSLHQLVTFSESAACGVVHLHSEKRLPSGRACKPSIAHRDLKSKNILVKSDGTCCISDFDLAIAIKVDSDVSDGHGQVGTLRYMAPEVLDGAISFKPEAFKHIDIYALSIIIYEITTRTVVPNDTSTVGKYRPPFDEVVSPVPTVEEMKQRVVTEQYRPPIPKAFRVNSELDIIKKTITESWDGDPDSRLSAECIADRLKTFRINRFGASEISKDSGISHQFSPLDNNETTPQPQTPSLSSAATLSPLESKTMALTANGARLSHSQVDIQLVSHHPHHPPPSHSSAFRNHRGNQPNLHSTETTV